MARQDDHVRHTIRIPRELYERIAATPGEGSINAKIVNALAASAAPAPLTAGQLADALNCFWNAAIGESHRQQDGIVFAGIMAEGFAAVAASLNEGSAS